MKNKVIKMGYAFAMVRTGIGYLKKECLIFCITDDAKKTKKTIDDFAKRQGAALVEVWYREDNNWGEIKPYKTYSYIKQTIDEDKLRQLGW